jgi:hypoxanthine phosphoribosyltransferase
MSKQFISPASLRIDSYQLAARVCLDNFVPDFIVAIWRGGAPIGCYVHEFLKRVGQNPDHIAIRTSRYKGIDVALDTIDVHNLGYLTERLKSDSKVLLIDDVWDSGLTIQAIRGRLTKDLGSNCPGDIRVATVYYKPTRNKTTMQPDYHVHISDKWLVFPHELEALSLEEIDRHIDPKVTALLRLVENQIK